MPANPSIQALADTLKSLDGWRRRGAAFAAGAASVLAMAPFLFWPILWITLPALVWLMDGAVQRAPVRVAPAAANAAWAEPTAELLRRRWYRGPKAAAAAVGWWFGFGYFVAGLFWIGEAFLVEAETFAVLLPFAVTLLPAGLALFYAAAAGLAARFWSGGTSRVVALALALSAMEWARGHVLTGFPWNVLGYALTYPLALMQSAALIGIYGLTLGAVLIFALPPVLWSEATRGPAGRRRKLLALAIALLPLAGLAAFGGMRLALASANETPGVKIRIVQPSVPQREKWRPENQQQIFLNHLELSGTNPRGDPDSLAGVTHVVWPEAAMPFLPLEHPSALAAIGRVLPSGTSLITGALRAEPAGSDAPRSRRVFNSILVFDEGGGLTGRYDKIHLVPFGEYLPFQPALEAIGLRQLTRLRGGFDVGPAPRPLLNAAGLPPMAPLICYEAIFPGAIVQGAERPSLLLNVTNDGWFGNTTGPQQHFHQARVRAVEEGLPLIRAANNGISAAVDGYGRMLGKLDVNARGVIDVGLPAAFAPPPYARFGDGTFWLLWLIVAIAMLSKTIIR